jgi:neutral ceramidase
LSARPETPKARFRSVVRIADRVIVTVPGEMTSGMGRRLRTAVLRAGAPSGLRRVVISGVANDFVQYVTTPEEYDRQHYEGGSTLFGRAEGIFIEERLAELVRRLVRGLPAPPPDPFDPRNGVFDDAPRFGRGSASGAILGQPRNARRLQRASFHWSGGPRGRDRPLDRAFVTVQRLTGGRWGDTANDLSLHILWTVASEGRYEARWEAPPWARIGRYRFYITANRYRLTSAPFRLRPLSALEARVARAGRGMAVIALRYPRAIENRDLSWRPARAARGSMTVTVGGRQLTVRGRRGRFVISGRPGAQVVLPVGAARDRHGNTNRNRLRFRL